MWPFTNKPTCGFLLFEVMVAVTVASVVLVFITRGFSSSLRAVGLSEETLTGVFIAEGKLSELAAELGQRQDAAILNGGGRFSSPYDDFSWSVRSEEVDELPLHWVHLAVEWQAGSRRDSIEMDTYFYHPGGTPSGASP